jgi:hypothetical protein
VRLPTPADFALERIDALEPFDVCVKFGGISIGFGSAFFSERRRERPKVADLSFAEPAKVDRHSRVEGHFVAASADSCRAGNLLGFDRASSNGDAFESGTVGEGYEKATCHYFSAPDLGYRLHDHAPAADAVGNLTVAGVDDYVVGHFARVHVEQEIPRLECFRGIRLVQPQIYAQLDLLTRGSGQLDAEELSVHFPQVS